MADTVRRVQYSYVTIPDKPGEAVKVLDALKAGGVNLVAFMGFPIGMGKAQIDLVADDLEAVKTATAKAGLNLKLSETMQALLIQGGDRPGAADDNMRKLSDAKINITMATAVNGGSGRYGMIIWVRPTDYDRAAKVLGA